MNHRCHPLVAAFASFALAACGAELPGDGPDESLGEAQAEITTVPGTVRCIAITAAGATSVTSAFTVSPGAGSATLALGRLPLGFVSFSSAAFDSPCVSSTQPPAGDPSWIGEPLSATLVAGRPASLSLVFHPNLPATASVDFLDSVASISVGQQTYAIMLDGSVRAWGGFNPGQLGLAGTALTPVAVPVLAGAKQIANGGSFSANHTCALLAGGAVECWGTNSFGQLGDGTTTSRDNPVLVSGISDASQVTIGGRHTCASVAGNSVKCWGSDQSGQFGDGSTLQRTTPVFSGFFAPATSAGLDFTCAQTLGGVVQCAGLNTQNQLGDGTTTSRTTPLSAANSFGTVQIESGDAHTCLLRADGAVFCWGRNSAGQLGDGTTVARATPVQVSGITTAVQITAGGDVSCALLANKTVRCWGNGSQLGNGAGVSSAVPVTALNLTGVAQIDAGPSGVCAVLENGGVRCWGDNSGDGTRFTRFVPTPVRL